MQNTSTSLFLNLFPNWKITLGWVAVVPVLVHLVDIFLCLTAAGGTTDAGDWSVTG